VGIVARVTIGVGLGIVFVFNELEGGDDQRRAIGQAREAEQPLKIAHNLASEGADVVSTDEDAERNDAAEKEQCRPAQYFTEIEHLALLRIFPSGSLDYRHAQPK
jgi:hypothetical protein